MQTTQEDIDIFFIRVKKTRICLYFLHYIQKNDRSSERQLCLENISEYISEIKILKYMIIFSVITPNMVNWYKRILTVPCIRRRDRYQTNVYLDIVHLKSICQMNWNKLLRWLISFVCKLEQNIAEKFQSEFIWFLRDTGVVNTRLVTQLTQLCWIQIKHRGTNSIFFTQYQTFTSGRGVDSRLLGGTTFLNHASRGPGFFWPVVRWDQEKFCPPRGRTGIFLHYTWQCMF